MTDITERRQRYLHLKQQLFDKLYHNLNPMQRQAIYTVNGPLLILAGAGSGKTTVLVNRVAHIIRYGDAVASSYVPPSVSDAELADMEKALTLPAEELSEFLTRFSVNPPPAWSVLAITFTNKAANEIKKRLAATFGEESSEASEIWAGTFHSVCMRLLRRYGAEVGYQSGFGICDTDDAKKLITACMKQLNIDDKQLSVKNVMNLIGRAKDRLLTPEEFADEAGTDFKLKQVAKIYTLYQSRLRASNLLDFDDIIMQTVKLLSDCPEVRESIQNRFRYVCVDEYQDTNKAQLVLTLLLSARYNNIMVVGDDDQSIYKFRGATIENILNFETTCKGASVVKLEQNYRSTKTILNAANSVIEKNTTRHSKKLWTDGAVGEKLTLRKLGNQNDEARYICEEIQTGIRKENRHYSDYAVLYRTNAQSRSIEQALTKSGIPYRMLGGLRFYDRMEIRDILAYLCVINNPLDDLRLKRIINVPKRGIGDKSVATAEAMAVASGYPMLEFIRHARDYKAIPAAAAKSMEELAQLIDDLRFEAAEKPVSELIRSVVEITGYGKMLEEAGEEDADRIENIGELISSAVQYENTSETPSLSAFLEDVALVSDVDKYDETADAAVLMTMHSAKGLEFPVVFLPGMEEGLFPGHQSIMNPEEIEEERRLAYVAITRAKEKLYITHVRDRMLNGSTQFNQLSRFVDEIDDTLIERIGGEEPSETHRITFDTPSFGYQQKSVFSKNGTSSARKPAASVGIFAAGDRVHHSTFGNGTVLSLRSMGGDTLYEIAFDDAGTKKLMATYAKLTKSAE